MTDQSNRGVQSDVAGYLEARLGGASDARSFLEAVVLHLSDPLTGGRTQCEAAVAASSTLLAALAGEEGGVAALRADPELLASFFQNADLLTTGGASAAAVGMTVMGALADESWGVRT